MHVKSFPLQKQGQLLVFSTNGQKKVCFCLFLHPFFMCCWVSQHLRNELKFCAMILNDLNHQQVIRVNYVANSIRACFQQKSPMIFKNLSVENSSDVMTRCWKVICFRIKYVRMQECVHFHKNRGTSTHCPPTLWHTSTASLKVDHPLKGQERVPRCEKSTATCRSGLWTALKSSPLLSNDF